MEEATLRAKIQAMKNLLEAKRQRVGTSRPPRSHVHYAPRRYARAPPSGPVNRSWSRFSPPSSSPSPSHVASASANKVWRRQDAATSPAGAATRSSTPPSAPLGANKTWKRPVKVAASNPALVKRAGKSMQLQTLRLEDGEYSKANGGFSLVRAGVKKSPPTVAVNKSPSATPTAPVTVSPVDNSVHIGGVKYVVANGGKVLKRCATEERKAGVVHRSGSMSLTTKSGAARAALLRAKAAIRRAHTKRLQAAKKAVKVRTVYCSFYNRFGYCKNKDACRFIHDSRRVAMCRKFLKNECSDPNCLLSHQHDENKVPDCKMFLRGACTRDGCKYRHVKVSAAAKLCEPFAKGYCPEGGACPLRHELPLTKRKSPTAAAASVKGAATGLSTNASDHRPQVPDVLVELSCPVRLDEDGDGTQHSNAADFGTRLELLSLRVQREIWSALASGASPSEDAAVSLARAYLRMATRPRRRESDAVCLALARMVMAAAVEQEGNEQVQVQAQENTTTDAAFRRRMRRLTLNRVRFPTPQEEEDRIYITAGPQKTLPLSGGVESKSSSRVNKRSRANAPQDLVDLTDQDSKHSTPASTLPEVKAQERPPLTREMEDRASALAKQLVQLSSSDPIAVVDDVATRAYDMLTEVVNDVHTTYDANERSFQCLCQVLRMGSTSDEALFQITGALVDSNWSSRYAAIFLETSVLPKIRVADSVISRVLLQTALRFGSAYAGTLVDSLLLPLLVGSNNADSSSVFGPAQAEAITRILRSPDTVPADQIDDFIQRSLAAMVTGDDGNSCHLLSNESALLVFLNILNTKPILSPLTVERFVGACEAALERPEGEQLKGSLKFATVIFTLISKYPQQCAGHVETLEAVANQLTSIMAKTTVRSLQKLKANK
ncbi:Zinc finger CCCH domain-containing protein 3 [Phytophthora cinnamomi]|uniref:Zinc finger CCCH domain-containing protein 3 n=1 Tax=Phytophthora cinnamomi TaxID=4785 RepID=UPI003559D680|nr:Zinc finger CCCH domain-containing protein 3 [Phytophthora cinnamomi]